MPEVLNIRMKGTEERIIEMEDKTLEITPYKEQRKKQSTINKNCLRDLSNYRKRSELCAIRISKGDKEDVQARESA